MSVALAAVLDRVGADSKVRHGVPTADQVTRRERGTEIVRRVLAEHLRPDGLRVSPLGAGWSRDVDVYLSSWPDEATLRAAGWLPLDDLLGRLGHPGAGRWAVIDGKDVLVAVDFHTGRQPEPIDSVLGRCRRRREVRLREALELGALFGAGHKLEGSDPVVEAAAAIESWWGGDALAIFRSGEPTPGPVALAAGRVRRTLRQGRRLFSRRVTVAISGVDGAGKSTVGASVREALSRVGLPVATVWARPGLHLGVLTKFSRLVKRAMGQPSRPGVEMAARGQAAGLRSRRGAVGWIWSLVVTLAFLVDVYRQHLKASGVVVYDRHVADAIVTLNVLYAGPDLRLQRALVRWLMPRAEFTAYLDIDADAATRRKPDDMIGRAAVEAQLRSYAREIENTTPRLTLSGSGSVEDNTLTIVRRLLLRDASLDAGS